MSHGDIFDQFGKLLPALLVILGGLAAKKKAGQVKAARGAPPAVDEAERTRRVREEVQRKIAARQSRDAGDRLARLGAPPPPLAAPARPAPAAAVPADVYEAAGSARTDAYDLAAPVRNEEQRLTQEVRAMQAAQAMPEAVFTPYTPPAVGAAPESPWFAELRQPGGARRAIVLREILGPPVALR